jgi:hypothetical protein
MVAKSLGMGLAVGLIFAGARWTLAAVSSAEDLTGCRLPNKRVTLPAAGSAAAKNGLMYKFSKDEFSGAPAGFSPDEIQTRTAEAGTADLQYLPEKDGSLWAFSGAISEVPGALYLADQSGKKLDEPWAITRTTENYVGQARNIMEGAVYLLKTTDGKYVLLRVLEKTPTAVVIQYVYQADGGFRFDIPSHPTVPYLRPIEAEPRPETSPPAGVGGVAGVSPAGGGGGASAPRGGGGFTGSVPPAATERTPATARAVPTLADPPHPALGPRDVVEPGVIRLLSPDRAPGLEPTIDTFASQRTQMLQRRLNIITALARTPDEVDKKAQAIADLTALHADEAVVADLLVREISFFNPRSQDKEFSQEALHPCFAALKRMGKPATTAAMKGLADLDLGAPGAGIDSAMYKAKLLGTVIRSVEGDDAAEFLFKREAGRAPDARQRAVWESVMTK